MSISITRLAKQLNVSPGVVQTLIEHHNVADEEIYAPNGELTDRIAANVRIQLNLDCERRIPELYLG